MEILDKIPKETQRKTIYITLAVLTAAHIYIFKAWLMGWLGVSVVGYIDVGTVLGILGLLGLWTFYKRRL